MARLVGKVAVVLGAAGKDNIGQAIARAYAAEGAKLVVAGRKREPLDALAAELGGRAVEADITSKADLEALGRAALDAHGAVDIAVNCTGWAPMGPLLDVPDEVLDAVVELQFKGTYRFLQVFTGLMQARGGSVIQLSSASTVALIDNHAAYIGAKAGADALVRCFANEFGTHGIKYNSIAPGLTASPMTAEAMAAPGLEDAFAREYPLGRIGTTKDIADAAVWLASDESFVTGQLLHVNGGLTLRRNPRGEEIQAAVGAAIARLQAAA